MAKKIKNFIDTNTCITIENENTNYIEPNYFIEKYDKLTGFTCKVLWCYTEEEVLNKTRELNKEEKLKSKQKNRKIRYEYSACIFDK